MKILILSDDFPPNSFGGAGIIAFNQAKELKKLGNEVFVITTINDKSQVGKRDFDGLTIFSLFSNLSDRFRAYSTIYNPAVIANIRRIIFDIKPDIVHFHNIHSQISYHAISLAKKYSQKVAITFHDVMAIHYGKLFPKININNKGIETFDYKINTFKQFTDYGLRWNPFRNILIKHYLKKVDVKIAVSQSLKDALTANGIKDIKVLRNGISVYDFSCNKENVDTFKNKFNLINKRVIFFGGRISGSKGGMLALNLLITLAKEFSDVCLLVAGKDDEYTKKLKDIANKNGVGEKFIVTGWLDRKEIVSAYYSSNLVLVPSLYLDPFPTVNLEAMACNKPIIGTKYGGTPEVVVNNENGFIIDPYKPEEVFKKTKELLYNLDLSSQYGRNGYSFILTKFNMKNTVNKLVELYEKR